MNRILHVVYQMDRGGIETWLMHVLRNIDRGRFQFDFLVHTKNKCAYDDEIDELGGRLFHAPHPSKIWSYGGFVRGVLRNSGPFAAVHCHSHAFDGHVLRSAAVEHVPLRIVHSHNTNFYPGPDLLHKVYDRINRHWTAKYVTTGLACSEEAAAAEFGADWKKDSRWSVLPCSLDFSPYKERFDRQEVRRELGIPERARVVGHVGRFFEQKNHVFLLTVFQTLCEYDPLAHLLLIGDGPLRPSLEQQAANAGIRDRVTFAGVRSDVPRLLLAATDVFLFPSLFEGLPLTLLEAQAAGLPCVCSDVITTEADLVPPLIHRVSLSEIPAAWAQITQELLDASPTISQADALTPILASRFNLCNTIHRIEDLYSSIQPIANNSNAVIHGNPRP